MEHDSSRSDAEHSWQGLMKAFIALLDADLSQAKAHAVRDLFFNDPWFQQLVERRVKQSVATKAVPRDWGDDLRQEISLLFARKVERLPDLHVDREMVDAHFGGWMWTIVNRLGIEAVERLHRLYRVQSHSVGGGAIERKENLELKVDLSIAMAELPALTRNILQLYDKGYKLTEIAGIVDEKYWKVFALFRRGVEYLREKLADR